MRLTKGFTLVEMMIVVFIVGIVASIALPSFYNLLQRKRVEGAHAELASDLQFARSEAVQRNAIVRVTFGSGCYVIHTVGTSGSTSCTQAGGATLATGATSIKVLQLPSGSPLSISTSDSMSYVAFDGVRGMATWDGSGTSGGATVSALSNTYQLRAAVSAVGRVQTCSPNSSIGGYTGGAC